MIIYEEEGGYKKKINSFQDLLVWKEAHQFVIQIYPISGSFPSSEKYGLTDQLRRAAVSIPANIAEGMGRSSKKELIQYLYIARGSLQECQYYLILALDLKYISSESYNHLKTQLDTLGRMMNGFIKSLKAPTTP